MYITHGRVIALLSFSLDNGFDQSRHALIVLGNVIWNPYPFDQFVTCQIKAQQLGLTDDSRIVLFHYSRIQNPQPVALIDLNHKIIKELDKQ